MRKLTIILFILCGFFACDEVVGVDDISNDNIVILAPANGVTLTNSTINFTWEILEEADSYKIQIAAPTFEEAQQIILDSLITVNSYSKILENGGYEWRVKAVNSEFETTYTTSIFTVEE